MGLIRSFQRKDPSWDVDGCLQLSIKLMVQLRDLRPDWLQKDAQTFGIDYQETFASLVKMNSIRVLISLAVNFGWPLNQFDVKNVFLSLEEVYMTPTPGFQFSNTKGKLCKSKKALYGLKQLPRAWFERFQASMFGLYVDEIVVNGNDDGEITRL